MPNFLSLVQRPHHSVRVKPQSRECHGLKRWIEAARKRLHRNVLAIACGRAGRSPGRLPAPGGRSSRTAIQAPESRLIRNKN
jgi:hypothetical protein